MAVFVQCHSVTDQQLDVTKKDNLTLLPSICMFGLQVNDCLIKVWNEIKGLIYM